MEELRKMMSFIGGKISMLRKGPKIVLVLCAWLLVIGMLLAFGL